MADIMGFLKKPVFTLDGFQVTVMVLILVALAFMVYRKMR